MTPEPLSARRQKSNLVNIGHGCRDVHIMCMTRAYAVRRGEHLQGTCCEIFANPWIAHPLPPAHILSLCRPRERADLAGEFSPTKANIPRLARCG